MKTRRYSDFFRSIVVQSICKELRYRYTTNFVNKHNTTDYPLSPQVESWRHGWQRRCHWFGSRVHGSNWGWRCYGDALFTTVWLECWGQCTIAQHFSRFCTVLSARSCHSNGEIIYISCPQFLTDQTQFSKRTKFQKIGCKLWKTFWTQYLPIFSRRDPSQGQIHELASLPRNGKQNFCSNTLEQI